MLRLSPRAISTKTHANPSLLGLERSTVFVVADAAVHVDLHLASAGTMLLFSAVACGPNSRSRGRVVGLRVLVTCAMGRYCRVTTFSSGVGVTAKTIHRLAEQRNSVYLHEHVHGLSTDDCDVRCLGGAAFCRLRGNFFCALRSRLEVAVGFGWGF